LPSGLSPSIVVIFFPAAAETGVWHDRTATPLRCTVHAPHCATPQPNFVPVSWRCSRITQSSGVSGGTSTVRGFPLMTSVAMGRLLPLWIVVDPVRRLRREVARL
jgi:hypothetical protein